MASGSAAGAGMLKVAMPAAFIMLVLLSMGPARAMASMRGDCRAFCIPWCQANGSGLCGSVAHYFLQLPIPLPLDATCNERFVGVCVPICMNICTANTLTPSGSPETAPPPPQPCKQ
jgi:hypothetical protein